MNIVVYIIDHIVPYLIMPKQPTKFYLKRENGREKYPAENSKKKEMEEKIYRLKKKIKELERNLKNEKKKKKKSNHGPYGAKTWLSKTTDFIRSKKKNMILKKLFKINQSSKRLKSLTILQMK